MKTPVLLMVYIKPETTIKVVEKLKEIRARKIYISINIPPNKNKSDIKKNLEVKKIIGNIKYLLNKEKIMLMHIFHIEML